MFSIYRNTYDVESSGGIDLAPLYRLISLQEGERLSHYIDFGRETDSWPFEVDSYRKYGTQRIKLSKLPAVIFYGTTAPHDRKVIQKPSGYFCVDLDYGDNKVVFEEIGIEAVKAKIAEVFGSAALIFVSPSGKGLKVVHKIRPEGLGCSEPFHVSHKAFENYRRLYKKIGLAIDSKCKDWNRLCYLSFDRQAYYNPGATADIVKVPRPKPQPQQQPLQSGEKGYQLSNNRRDKDQICPYCSGGQHRDRSFTYYVDEMGNRIEGSGYCSRNKCSAGNVKPRTVHPHIKWKYIGRIKS